MKNILYEDDQLIAASKPSGLLTHPSNECRQVKESLLFMLRDHCKKELYPVNRLDRPVSGINLFAKEASFISLMQKAWPDAQKEYLGLAHGEILQDGQFNFDLRNDNKIPQKSITNYQVLENFKDSSLMKISIETGRRHQIRRHFSRRMHALIGDRKYGKKKWNDSYLEKYDLKRIFLHAQKLEFLHPLLNEKIIIKDPIGNDLLIPLNKIRKDYEKK